MDEDILAIGGFFFTVIVLGLGIPLIRAYAKRRAQMPVVTRADIERDERLARIETAVDTLAVEIERISEGQRFVTRLLAERAPLQALPAERQDERGQGEHEVPR